MSNTSKLWLVLGGIAFCLFSAAAFIFANTIIGFASVAINNLVHIIKSPRKEVYVYADRGWLPSAVERAKLVHVFRGHGCRINLHPIAEIVSDVYNATIVESFPKGQVSFDIVPRCHMRRSTFYRLPAAFEVWINFCDGTVSSKCALRKVFAFTRAIDAADWPCVKAIIRRELTNYGQNHVRRSFGLDCR